jgi:hypothetical protein
MHITEISNFGANGRVDTNCFSGLPYGLLKRSFVENLLFENFDGKVNDVDIQRIWKDLGTHYSSRNLTVDTDKVRAISGITEALRWRFALKNFHYGL